MDATLTTFVAVVGAFTLIGVLSATRSQRTTDDYLLASRSVHPVLTALSSMATNFSGYMFIGLIGFGYTYGVSSMWLSVGWITGDLLAWWWVHQRVRERSERVGATTVPTLIAHDGTRVDRTIVVAGATVLIVFLTVYGAAQLSAGSKALQATLGWSHAAGAWLGAAMALIYCLAGGIRASIWTDAAQAVVMTIAMFALWLAARGQVGGFGELLAALKQIDPALVQLFPENGGMGFGLYLLGWVIGGLGSVGQPHILVRSMAIRSAHEVARARHVYILSAIPFTAAAVVVSLYARVLLGSGEGFDPELALPTLAAELFPPAAVGLVLAGLFSATMSTADSLILSCSASITQDLAPRRLGGWIWAKIGTVAVTMGCLAIALWAPTGVLALVLIAWSALASTFGPLLILRLWNCRVSSSTALAMMAVGLGTAVLWRQSPLSASVFELLPASAAAFITYGLLRGNVAWRTSPHPKRPRRWTGVEGRRGFGRKPTTGR